MSWYNPSQDEAAEEYYSSKRRYTNAANQRNAAKKAAENCCAEKSQAISEIKACKSEKLNFEKRIEDIRCIIGALDGSQSGGILIGAIGTDVPGIISRFNECAGKADASYKESMKCSDMTAASIQEVFKSKSVEEDVHTSDALAKFKAELARLQQAVADLQAQINSLSSTVDELTSKINSYNAEQMNWRKVMVSSAYEMNHYKGYM